MRKFTVILIFGFCLFTFHVFCQSISWQKVFFNTQSIPYRSIQTNDGGYVTTGYTDFGSNNFLIKQNVLGDTLWIKYLGGRSAHWVEQTWDEGFIIGGSTAMQYITAQLVKTDLLGNILWQRTYENIYGSQVSCAKQTSDSGYILALRWGLSNGQDKIMLLKTDSLGGTIWQKIYNGPGFESPGEVTLVNNSGYIIAGTTSNGFISGTDIFIIRANLNGDTVWTKIIGNSNYGDVVYQIQNTADRGFILVGWTESFTVGVRHESYVIKMDSLGNIQWQKLYSSLGYDESYAVRATNNNGYVIAGYSDTMNNGDGRAKIRILDNSGNVIQQTSFKPTEQEAYFNSVEPTTDGGFILCGETHNTNGQGRVYIVKTDSLGYANPIGIINNNKVPIDFKVYQNFPNPFNSLTIIKFDLKKTGKVRIEVYDLQGREITILLDKLMPTGEGHIIFDAEKYNLASGIYFYRFTFNSLHLKTFSINKKMVYLK